ncbi:MAG: HDOD domain-containing protein [Fuerstiella sp.]
MSPDLIHDQPALSPASTVQKLLQSQEVELPVLPEVAVQLLKLTSDVDCDPKDIVDLFRRDQSLTGHLLKIANSARYSSGQTVTSIQQAVARLGLLQVREVVVLVSCETRVFNVGGFEADVKQSFVRSMATAAFAQEVARARRLNVEDAFLCGLLHDVGRPVLLQLLSDYRTENQVQLTDEQIRQAADEFRIPLACRLVESWELPARLSTIIEHQNEPLAAGDCEQQAAILNLGSDLAATALDPDTELPAELIHPMMDVLNLYPEDMAGVLAQSDSILEWVRSSS